jgi:alcohol sulfotransferase
MNREFSLYFENTNPKIHFTHNFFDWFQSIDFPVDIIDKEDYDKKKIIIMVRDPRDVAVSYYHQHTNRDLTANRNFNNIDEFVLDPIYGIERQSEFVLKLLDFYEEYEGKKLLLKYEELKKNDLIFHDIINFVFDSVNEEDLKLTIDKSKFDNMRKRELSTNGGILGKRNGWNGDINSLKTRKAKIGSYKEELRENTIEKINNLFFTNKLLQKIG